MAHEMQRQRVCPAGCVFDDWTQALGAAAARRKACLGVVLDLLPDQIASSSEHGLENFVGEIGDE